MMSFSEFAYSLLPAYGIYQLVLVLWGIAALATWNSGPHARPPVILETYPIFQLSTFDVRFYYRRPRPVDIAKAVFCTFCPVVNVLLMGSMFLWFVVVSVYHALGAGVRWASRLATGDANRVKNWFFTPLGHD